MAVNPKEYHEYFENVDHNNFDAPINECIRQQRFTVIGGEMKKSTAMKTKFSQTNNKRYC